MDLWIGVMIGSGFFFWTMIIWQAGRERERRKPSTAITYIKPHLPKDNL